MKTAFHMFWNMVRSFSLVNPVRTVQLRASCTNLLNVCACVLQVNHASDVWVMGKAEPESYDGIVTNQSEVVLAAPGADCMPVLFADPVSMVIGAAHAGRCFIHLFIFIKRDPVFWNEMTVKPVGILITSNKRMKNKCILIVRKNISF